jgi:predicted DNA-binding protein (MmcQ/YjbR family)
LIDALLAAYSEAVDRTRALRTCRALESATEDYPFGDTVAVFKLGGKIFAMVTLDGSIGQLSLKCDPAYAIGLREQYPAVTAGYHLNKRHWNTIALDGSVASEAVGEWIQDSYDLILASLSRTERATLA